MVDLRISPYKLCVRGFVKFLKNPKILEKLESGWVGEAPTQILIFLGKFCVFCVVVIFPNVSKKQKIG